MPHPFRLLSPSEVTAGNLEPEQAEKVDSTLDALMEEHGEPEDDETPKGRERDGQGRFKPKAEEKASEGPEDDEDDLLDEDEEEDVEVDEDGPGVLGEAEYDEAVRALKRAKVPLHMIEQIAADDPKGFREWAAEAQKQHVAWDEAQKKHSRTADELAQHKRTAGKTGSDVGTPAADDQAAPDVGKAVKPVVDYFVERYGDGDLDGPMREFAESLVATVNQTVESRISSMENRLGDQGILRSLASEFPMIKSKDGQAEVRHRISQLERMGDEYASREDLVRDAIEIQFARQIAEREASDKVSRREAKRNGAMDASGAKPRSRRPKQKTPQSEADRIQDESLEALLSNDSKSFEESKREARDLMRSGGL